jgi:hypothetical protein
VQRIIARGQEQGQLRTDVDFGDIGLLLVRLSRPLPAPIPPELEARMAHRHLDLFLAALRAAPSEVRLGGAALSLAELQSMAANSPASH